MPLIVPPSLVNALWPNFVDVNNNTAKGLWTLQDQAQLSLTPYADLLTATQDLSCMALYSANLQRRGNIAATPVSGPYCTNRDRVVMVLQSANTTWNLEIPGPIAGIFLADNETVDTGNPLVQAWFGAVAAILGDPIGSPWTILLKGYRTVVP